MALSLPDPTFDAESTLPDPALLRGLPLPRHPRGAGHVPLHPVAGGGKRAQAGSPGPNAVARQPARGLPRHGRGPGVVHQTPRSLARQRRLDAVNGRYRRKGGYILGDLTKGGREATADEVGRLAGAGPEGRPRGLERCPTCGEWRGRCLDPSPTFVCKVMTVHCTCQNDNRSAACGGFLYERKLNATYYNARPDLGTCPASRASAIIAPTRSGTPTMRTHGEPMSSPRARALSRRQILTVSPSYSFLNSSMSSSHNLMQAAPPPFWNNASWHNLFPWHLRVPSRLLPATSPTQ
jgi:hypothetical protein